MREAAIQLVFAIFSILIFYANSIDGKGMQYVTCGSTLKLMNVHYKARLHSHDIAYGSGSRQQSVTGTEAKEDGNSYWLVKAETKKHCIRGQPLKCGDVLRLEHIATKKNLHSHRVSSPISHKQEVSAYGIKGEGDSGDHWQVMCNDDFWRRDKSVRLKHIDTDAYLSISGRTYKNPIAGQLEVVADYSPNSPHVQWIAAEGVFIHPNDFKAQHHVHSEL